MLTRAVSADDLAAEALRILAADPVVARARAATARLGAPEAMLVSGVLYNSIWNHLTGRPPGYGVKDVDVFYFDASDLSWEAEDVVIRRAAALETPGDPPMEVRNQARAHLWYPEKFGRPYPPLRSAAESLERFASMTHAVGLPCDPEAAGTPPQLVAPYGLADIFDLVMRPNPIWASPETFQRKAERIRSLWPEVRILEN